MNNNENFSNYVKLRGHISKLELAYEKKGKKYYKTYIEVKRKPNSPNKYDILPVIIYEDLLLDINVNDIVKIKGFIYSEYAKPLETCIFVKEMVNTKTYTTARNNYLHLKGFLCKVPFFKTTNEGLLVASTVLAVHSDNKKNYIYVVLWNDAARNLKNLKLGDEIEVHGRFQSRSYKLKSGNNTRTVYEAKIFHVLI